MSGEGRNARALTALRRLPSVLGGAERFIAPLRRSSGAGGRIRVGHVAKRLAVVLIAVPTFLAAIYYLLIASPVYVSEAKFAVRTLVERDLPSASLEGEGEEESVAAAGEGALPGGMNRVAGDLGNPPNQQDPFVVASMIASHDFATALNEGGWLVKKYSSDTIDPVSRLSPDATVEDIFRHWRRHAVAAVDRRANTVVLQVRAYTAEDAREIAARILALAEEQLNLMTGRQRQDTLDVAETELARAQARHEAIVMRLREMRREQNVVNPLQDVENLATSLYRLMSERIELLSERETLRRNAGPGAIGIDDLSVRIEALDGQIDELQGLLVGGENADRASITAIAAMEEIELERRFAETHLNMASASYDSAARDAERQLSFLMVFIEPTLPGEPTEPRRLASIALVAGLGLLVWLFTTVVVAIVSDQTA